jgi:hypothetical protein
MVACHNIGPAEPGRVRGGAHGTVKGRRCRESEPARTEQWLHPSPGSPGRHTWMSWRGVGSGSGAGRFLGGGLFSVGGALVRDQKSRGDGGEVMENRERTTAWPCRGQEVGTGWEASDGREEGSCDQKSVDVDEWGISKWCWVIRVMIDIATTWLITLGERIGFVV